MKRTIFGLGLVTGLVLLASAASANTLPDARYAEMMTIEMMDTNKDGMVSREEYLEAAGKMFDMAAKHMKVKEGKMTSVQLREYRSALATPK
jgi:uncharacterized protein YqgQ